MCITSDVGISNAPYGAWDVLFESVPLGPSPTMHSPRIRILTAAGAWEDLRNMIEARYWQRMGDEGEEYRRLQAIVEPLGCVHWGPKEPLLKSWRS